MQALIRVFEGNEVTFRRVDERWGMTAEQLGNALGYADPNRRINDLIKRHRDELAPFVGVCKVQTAGGEQDTTFVFDQGIPLVSMFARTEKAAAFRLWVATLLVDLQRGDKQAVDSDAIAYLFSKIKDLEAKTQDPKHLIAASIAANLTQLSPAVQKIVVTTALSLPAEQSTTWTATAVANDLAGLGIMASNQKVGKVAIAHGVQCPKVEQQNEYGFWSTTSVNNYSKLVDCFLYNKAGRDRLIAIFTAANSGQVVA